MGQLIKLKNVSKIYKLDGVTVPALKNISLSIKKGEFVSLMGPSGSGKSTLMHIIGLLGKPTSGKVYFEEKDVSKLNNKDRAKLRNKQIGFIFQQFNLLPRTSAVENVKLPLTYLLKNHTSSKKINKDKEALTALAKVGLAKRAKHYPNQLSGGEQQRVAIARALINKPSLILADEPTGNLDTKTGKQIMRILTNLNKEGKTILVVTHEKEVAKYAKKIINIVDGQITK